MGNLETDGEYRARILLRAYTADREAIELAARSELDEWGRRYGLFRHGLAL